MVKKSYDEGSIADFAVKGLNNIKKLAGSSLMSEKLIGLSTFLFTLIFTFNFGKWLISPQQLYELTALVILLFGLLTGLGLSSLYSSILLTIADFAKDKIQSLRLGLVFLFMSIPFSIAGLVFNSIFFTYTSWIFIGIQLALVLFGFFFKFAFQSVVDIKVSTSGIWKAIGKAGSIASILGLLLAILMIVAPQYFGQVVYQCVDGTLEKSIDSCPNVESYLIQLAKEQSYNLSKSL
tara:strand:+ start:333 stop:1040 length:708 start_codon:yes stop_codon:yes gene_type:complete